MLCLILCARETRPCSPYSRPPGHNSVACGFQHKHISSRPCAQVIDTIESILGSQGGSHYRRKRYIIKGNYRHIHSVFLKISTISQ